jgi:hypothetical protein
MKLKPLGSNMTLIRMNNGTEVLFSYSTPVAGYYRGEATNAMLDHEYFRTDEWYSNTTTRHINKYLDGVKAVIIGQEEINSIVS